MGVAPFRSDNESQFRIEATEGFREPRSRILKHGDTFAVLNHFGDMVSRAGSPDGLYHQDWHVEDNPVFSQQAGLVTVARATTP